MAGRDRERHAGRARTRAAIAAAQAWFDGGGFAADARAPRRVPHRKPARRRRAASCARYLADEIGPSLAALGFTWRIVDNPVAGRGPFLIARAHRGSRAADGAHVRPRRRRRGLRRAVARRRSRRGSSTVDGDRWYGRGTADNKGQHTINLAALGQRARGARAARLQREAADRDGRGSRLARPARRCASASARRSPPTC